jgi:hypothetical protein
MTMVTCRDESGQLRNWRLQVGEEVRLPGTALLVNKVLLDGAIPLIRKTVPIESGRSTPELYDLLDNEIRAGVRLAGRYSEHHYPAELSRLVGYCVDAEEPYVLLADYAGAPAAERVGGLMSQQRGLFSASLLRAVSQLALVDLVHGAIGLDMLRWDGTRVQLVNFESATAVGERRPNVPGALRTAFNDPGDDVLAAGIVIFGVHTGRLVTSVPAAEDIAAQGTALQHLLAGVFAPEPNQRPSASEVLDRLPGQSKLVLTTPHVHPDFAQGQLRFEEVRNNKLASNGGPVEYLLSDLQSRSVPPRWPKIIRLTALAVLVVAMVTAAILHWA